MGLEKIKDFPAVKRWQIQHHSYVDIYGLLKSIPAWFNRMGYFFYEKGLAEKDIGSGDQIESDWFAKKDVTGYFQYSLELSLIIKDLRKVILENGEEIYWARILIIINGTLKRDYNEQYGGKWINKFLRELYERYIIMDSIKQNIGKIIVECNDLKSTLQESLK